MDGNEYSEKDVLDLYIQAVDEFKRDNPLFIGAKLIYAPVKRTSNETTDEYFKLVREFYDEYPKFLAGFDLVGQEETAPGLISFAEQILKLPSDLKFFFHAGETNWFGSVDENLVINAFSIFRLYTFPFVVRILLQFLFYFIHSQYGF